MTARKKIAEQTPADIPLYADARAKKYALWVEKVVMNIKNKNFNSPKYEADIVLISKLRAFKTEDTTLFSSNEYRCELGERV